MRSRPTSRALVLICALTLFGAGSALSGQQAQEADSAALEQAERQARAALEGFFVAFSRADNDALQEYCNYPHAFMGAAGSIRVIDDRWEMDFEALREREDWHSSRLDSARAFLVKEDKVHYEIVFSRLRADGTVYRTVPGLWVMTKQDGKWGLSLRSY